MRLRLMLSFVLVVLVSVVGVVLITRQNTASEVRNFMFRGGVAGLESLIAELEGYYRSSGSWIGVDELLIRAVRGESRGQAGRGSGSGSGAGGSFRLRLVDADGILVADTSDPAGSGGLSPSEMASAMALKVDGEVVGYLLPEGGQGYNQSEERYLLGRLNQAAVTAGLIAGGLSLILALILAYRLLRPVRELTEAAVQLGQGDLSQRVSIKGADELASLGQTFNYMAASLEEVQESRRAMTADIAHELRTPLAVQRAHLEALQDGIYPLEAANLEPILAQNLLLTRLVNDLRTLALADAGRLELEYSWIDLPGFVERIVAKFNPQAAAKNVKIEYLGPEDRLPKLSVDSLRLEQILNNLFSNALRHTPESGIIVVRLSRQANWALIAVHNSGSGIPEDALPHLFDRFYRGDKSRSRSQGGTGLGLAIARQLAEAHSGTLEAANDPGGGAVFELRIPLRAGQNIDDDIQKL
jgi:signal transduction histidine kinase